MFGATKEFQRDPADRPTWDMGTRTWNGSDWGRTPGYSFTSQSDPAAVTMRNSAIGDCAVHETNVSYTYQGTHLRFGPDRKRLALGDGQVNVSYDAQIQKQGDFSCAQHRAILTTDFIFEDPEHGSALPDVLSIVHYDPGTFQPVDSHGIQWETLDEKTNTCDAQWGCRVMVRAPQLLSDSSNWTPVNDDISALFDKYAAYLNPGNRMDKSQFTLRGIQVVSSNVGSSTTASVKNVDARLTPKAPIHSTLKVENQNGLCLDDYDDTKASPAEPQLSSCNGTEAQDWTIGLDNTLRVNGMCLDVANGATTDGAKVIIYTCNGGTNQQWVLGRWGNLYNPASGLCLTVTGGSVKPDTRGLLAISNCWGGTNQKWWTPYGDFQR
ncbi:ricin-type beta-trefoil lectin domain protein [Streptomyces sp. NPDC052040]|uniref:ricin-type beta-trefoil lectin domain protein n=1 Tax=Streptomyces sp. NPDC052040 TaxID=3365682 RepID=UPI0037D5E26A